MVSLGPHCVCRFHTEDYLVRSVSLKHPTLVYSNPLLPLCLLHALHIVCDISFSRMLVICTNACHIHVCLSYARMPVICTYACQMHVCLTYARMLAKSTYSCHMYVLRMRTICTYAWRTSVCLTCARIPDICTHACQGLQRFRCSSGQTFQNFSKIFLMKPIKYWFYHFFGQY